MPLNFTVKDPKKKKVVCLNEPFLFALNDTEMEASSEKSSIAYAVQVN